MGWELTFNFLSYSGFKFLLGLALFSVNKSIGYEEWPCCMNPEKTKFIVKKLVMALNPQRLEVMH